MSGKDDCYPACYRDRHGEEHILIHNDGSELTFTLRGVQFEGGELDSFAPTGWDQPDYALPHGGGSCSHAFSRERSRILTGEQRG